MLNAFGGKGTYAERYRADSASLREQGYRVASLTSWIGALGAGLPALFLAAVTWLGARLAAEGAITVGELVGVYGYIAVLVVPVSFFIEGSFQISHGLVAARQVTRFLALRAEERPWPAGPGGRAGSLVGLFSARPEESVALLEGLGGFDGTSLIADHDAALFAGTLREVLQGRGEADDEAIHRAVHVAAAQDVVAGLRHGLDSMIEPGGRNLSGGQRQRVRLTRALLAEPAALLAVEPTSALDAHTESLLAGRLRTARAGRTTVVATTSPLLLAQADQVLFIEDLAGGRLRHPPRADGVHPRLPIGARMNRDLPIADRRQVRGPPYAWSGATCRASPRRCCSTASRRPQRWSARGCWAASSTPSAPEARSTCSPRSPWPRRWPSWSCPGTPRRPAPASASVSRGTHPRRTSWTACWPCPPPRSSTSAPAT